MAFDSYLIDRIGNTIKQNGITWNEKRMFGDDCLLVDNKMLLGTYQSKLMVRVNPLIVNELRQNKFTEQMIYGGKIMSGFLMIKPKGYDMDVDFDFWIKKCLEYNRLAKSSKSKKK